MSKIKLSVNHKEVLRTDGRPELIKGGDILSLGNGFYYINGNNPKKTDDVDVDIVNSKKGVEVFSDENMLGGKSPADLVLEGADPNQVFAAQEQYKQTHGINDDGTKKKAKYGIFKRWFGSKKDNTQTPVNGENNNVETEQDALDEYFKDVRSRQAYAESKYDINIKNSKDAYGLYQIRPIGVADYNRITGENIAHEDVLNPDTALKVRDVLMDSYWNRGWINNSKNENDTVRMIKTLMAYNMGPGNALDTLNYMKANGVNIYNVEELLNNIPVNETKKYAKFVATGQSVGPTSYLNNSLYQLYKSRNIDLDNKIRTAKRYGGMGKIKKDIFIDSLIGSMNSLNKTKLNNVNEDNMNPIDLQILDRELNKDVLLRNSHSTGVQRKKCGGRIKAVRGTDGKDYTSIDKMPFGVFPAEANYNESNNKQDEADIARGRRAVNATHWLTYGLGAGADMLSAIIGSSVEHSTSNKAINKIKDLIGKIKSYNLALPNYNTHVEVEPQLAENRRTAAYLRRNVDADIIDSKKALAFKRKIENDKLYKDMLINQYQINEQNKLRNFKTKEQYNIINENIRNAANIENEKLAMMMGMVDKQAENDANLTRNIVGGINSGIRTLLTGLNQKEQMMIAGTDSPEGDNAIYGITGKRLREREEERERKRKEREDKRKAKNNKFDPFKQNDLLIG